MAKLPSASDFGPLAPTESRRQVTGVDLTGLGKGMQHAGADLAAVAVRDKNETDQLDEAQANAAKLIKWKDLRDTVASDKDPEAMRERYVPHFNQALDDAANLIQDPRKRQLFIYRNNPELNNNIAQIDARRDMIVKDNTITSVTGQLDDLHQKGLNEPDEKKRMEGVDTGRALIQGLYDKGYASAEWTQNQQKKWVSDYAKSWITMQPPEKQIELLRPQAEGKDAVLDRIAGVESGGNPNARAKTSSALGSFQFIEKIWLDTVSQYRPDLMEGHSRAEVLALRADPTLSREMAGHLLDQNAAALEGAGLKATPGNLYLSHFLGSAGAIKVLQADPGTPVSDVVDRGAVNANRSVLAGKTVGSITDWADRKMGGSAKGGIADFIPPEQRANMQRNAETAVTRQQNEAASAQAAEQVTVQGLIRDDLTKTATLGQIDDTLTMERVRAAVGEKEAIKWQSDREDAHAFWKATNDFTTIPNTEVAARVDALQPKAGDENFARRMALFEAAEKKANAVFKARAIDPAGSVSEDSFVKRAQAAVAANPKDQEALFNLAQARMGAQQWAQIPQNEQSPITREEAKGMLTPLRQAALLDEHAPRPRGQETRLVGAQRQLIDDLKTSYGRYADQAMMTVLRQATGQDKDQADAAGEIMKALLGGEMPGARAQRRFTAANEAKAAGAAVTQAPPVQGWPEETAKSPSAVRWPEEEGAPQPAASSQAKSPSKEKPWQAPANRPTPPYEAQQLLLNNPSTRAKFEQVFGPEWAARVMSQRPSAGDSE